MSLDIPLQRRRRFKRICAAIVTATGSIVLVGWTFDISLLKTAIPGFPAMKANTAIAFAFAGIALLLTTAEAGTSQRRIRDICAFVTLAIGGMTLFEILFDLPLGIDQLVFKVTDEGELSLNPGRMSPQSAVNFIVIALALLLLNRRRSLSLLSESLVLVAFAFTFAAMLGHLYGARSLAGTTEFNKIAIHAAVCFAILEVGCLAANRESRLVGLIFGQTLGSMAARRLLPVALLVPTFVGWVRVIGENRGMFDSGVGVAVTIFVSIALMCGSIYYFSIRIHHADLQHQSAQQAVAESQQRYRDLFDHSQGLMCIHELDGTITTINPAALTSLGFTLDEMVGRNLREFIPDEHRPDFNGYLRQIENEGLSEGMLSVVSKSGRGLVWRYKNIVVYEGGDAAYVLGHAVDVTELLEAQKALRDLSLTDPLTGLYNRRGFLTLAEQQIRLERHAGTARGLTLMFADMDGLKAINDTLGHEAGSEAIATLARLIKSVVRNADLVARWGGDEFVIMSIGAKEDNTGQMLERIRDTLAAFNRTSGKPYKIECSLGVAEFAVDGGMSIEQAIAKADEAMYSDKKVRKAQRGRGQDSAA